MHQAIETEPPTDEPTERNHYKTTPDEFRDGPADSRFSYRVGAVGYGMTVEIEIALVVWIDPGGSEGVAQSLSRQSSVLPGRTDPLGFAAGPFPDKEKPSVVRCW